MGRAENRKAKREMKKKLTPTQFEILQSSANKEIVELEVANQIKFYQDLWGKCIIEAFKKNGYSTDKAKMILDDIELIMLRKMEAKKNGDSEKTILNC